MTRLNWLSLVLALTGIAFLLLYPVTMLLPASWMWEPRQAEYEQMIVGIYFVLGVFTLIAARRPEAHLGIVWFVAASNIVHGGIMLVQALSDPAEYPNLYGDIPALLLSGILIALLAPKRLSPGPLTADHI